jgi:hypothetical protein
VEQINNGVLNHDALNNGVLNRDAPNNGVLNHDAPNNVVLNHDALNNHFLTVAKKISDNISGSTLNITNDLSRLTQYLNQTFKSPFPKTKFDNTSMKEIEKIIYSQQTKNSYVYI